MSYTQDQMIAMFNQLQQSLLEKQTQTEAAITNINSYLTPNTAKAAKTGNMVDITFLATVKTTHTLNGSGGIQIGIIPEEYRPQLTTIRTVYVAQGAVCKLAILWVIPTGSLMVYSADASLNMAVGHTYRICTTYQL
ncbi:hypothetical protein NIA71_00100 [Ihubacter massiliensis]|uniref:hypothetical protein n=1 Tax=Ihubacter massiliensis TaxID=1852367 RepID=UPI002098239E|nr:hypothetical protein [Ihubacter massiliensis]MCO7120354.1 hypothetical protein [Ihubacter massiliensis]